MKTQISRKQAKHLLWERVGMEGIDAIGTVCRIESHWGEDDAGRPKPGAGPIHIWLMFDQKEGKGWEDSKSYTLGEFNDKLKFVVGHRYGFYDWTQVEKLVEDTKKKYAEIQYSEDLVNSVARTINFLKEQRDRTVVNHQRFIREVHIFFQSLAIVADSVSRASTHTEKNARIRGLIEVIEGCNAKLVDIEEQELLDQHRMGWEPFFKSRYPVRRLLDKYNRQKTEISELKKLLKKNEIEFEDEMPF